MLLLLAGCLLMLPSSTAAQEFRATISGSVSDPSGAVVPGANIQIKETQSGAISRTTSGGDGQFVVPFLLPGDYTIQVTASGFQTLTRSGITLHSQDHPVLSLVLRVGSTNQTVTVTSAPPQLDTANASVNSVITTSSVANLPLNGRTPAALAELSAGVISTAAPEQVHPFDNNAGNSWSIGGTPNQVSEVLLDGSPDETLLGALAFSPSQDSVQEVSVQPFATDASLGHTIGGVINQVTKSGTNSFHGTAYEFGQISGIDANLYFNSAPWNKGTPKPLPVFHFNQYGLTFGGPVIAPKIYNGKNKTFFFFAWEGLKDSTPAATTLTVPTTQSASGSPGTGGEANGDFFQILQAGCPNGIASYSSNVAMCAADSSHSKPYADPYQLYDPRSGQLVNGKVVRSPIYQNQLRSVDPNLDAVGLAFMKLFPAPNATGTSLGQDNYISNAPSIDNYDNEFGRLDFNIGSSDHLFFDFRHNNRGQVKQDYFGNHTTGTTLTRENWGTTLDNVYTLNPTTIFDVRLNWTLFNEAHGSPAQAFSPTDVGLPSSMASSSTMVQLPYINFNALGTACDSYECFGNNGASIDPGGSYQAFVDVIKVLGKHTLKAGFDGRQYRLSVTNYGNSSGTFTFDTSWTNAGTGGVTKTTGYDLAALLLGVPSSGEYDLNARGDYHQYYIGTFLQDDWHVNNRLTLNLGLRFDINTPYEERLGKTVNGFDPTAPVSYASNPAWTPATETVNGQTFTISSINTNGGLTFANGKNGAVFATNSGSFSPRFGFSYSLNDKTVVRGGFGFFVMPETMSNMAATGVTSSNALSNQQGFSAATSFVTSTNGYLPTNSLENPFPSGFTAPATSGSQLGTNTFLGSPSQVSFLAPSQYDPYSERWDIGVQRAITSNLMVEALYEGNHGVHLPVGQHNINAVQQQYLTTAPYFDYNLNTAYGTKLSNNPFKGTLGASNTTGLNTSSTESFGNFVVPFPQFDTKSIYEQNMTIGQSWFDAAIIHVEQRMEHGLTLTANYAFSKMMESDTFLNDQSSFLEHRVSPFDHTHHFTAGGSYALPFGRGKLFSMGNSRLWDEIAGGFVVNGIYQFQSGAPIYFSSDIPLSAGVTPRDIKINNRDLSRTPATAALSVASFVTSSNPKTCTGTCDGTVNIGGQYVDHYRTLPSTFSWVRGDGYNNLDASVLKDFHISEGSYFQLRFETFNTLNHPTFDPPAVNSATSSTFGMVTATSKNSLPRQIQIGGRLVF